MKLVVSGEEGSGAEKGGVGRVIRKGEGWLSSRRGR